MVIKKDKLDHNAAVSFFILRFGLAIHKRKTINKKCEELWILQNTRVLIIARCSMTAYDHFHKIFRLFDVIQILRSPQVKRCAIITYKHGIYELHCELPNNLRILGN